jgi:hypothetical protein
VPDVAGFRRAATDEHHPDERDRGFVSEHGRAGQWRR